MQNPTNQGGEWEHVPSSDFSAGSAPASNVYASSGSGYPPPNDPNYPPPPPQGGGYPPQGGGGYPPPQGGPPQGDGLSPTAAAAIAYITIIPAIIFLVMDPYKRMALVRFHSLQCLFFAGAWIVVDILAAIILHILSHIPVLGCVVILIWPLIGLFFLIVWILCIFKASKGEYFKLPVIGDLALKMSQQV
ncbi:DUF4870 domain-containing protein [Granulicella sp. S156]|jgi:uncharacterized membrane protein|uniref:DUF4870 domain-containing protein n=1 Tax=Granulicella sp. S156 TaxID=1747224 RepID=UPI00131B9F39|nr:DUF4870 domain-containing protein [Granulicella sp. S156]